jgi:hypothetical protein
MLLSRERGQDERCPRCPVTHPPAVEKPEACASESKIFPKPLDRQWRSKAVPKSMDVHSQPADGAAPLEKGILGCEARMLMSSSSPSVD